jgi:hypothetical protein
MTKKLVIVSLVLMLASTAFAQVSIDWAGKLYNQMRWTTGAGGFGAHTNIWGSRNDDRFGNFVRSEAEFEMNATVSKYVKVYLRMKTIFDSDDPSDPNEANASAWQTSVWVLPWVSVSVNGSWQTVVISIVTMPKVFMYKVISVIRQNGILSVCGNLIGKVITGAQVASWLKMQPMH